MQRSPPSLSIELVLLHMSPHLWNLPFVNSRSVRPKVNYSGHYGQEHSCLKDFSSVKLTDIGGAEVTKTMLQKFINPQLCEAAEEVDLALMCIAY
ncbi:hypothetical protein VNO80_15478 [Phaseolus coccineus]|uniref:Uncharacterized protein n=1 Tax=Phaseolus coccineus TaxID=3886 RepID=A0AAN9R2C5_PHACN